MKKGLVLILLTFLTQLVMAGEKPCWQLVTFQQAEDILERAGYLMGSFPLGTNGATAYFLEDKRVVVLPDSSRGTNQALLAANTACFGELYDQDFTQVETLLEPTVLQEIDRPRVRHLNRHLSYFQGLLNAALGTNYQEIDEAVARDYYAKCRAQKVDMEARPELLLALGTVVGEALRLRLNGRWAMCRRFGALAPYYSPAIVPENYELVDDILSAVAKAWHRKDENLDFFFFLYPKDAPLSIEMKEFVDDQFAPGKMWFFLED
jgi:hypothetical protein